ncbi:MAG TPA: polysaccharide biosynthesis/export family protein [Terriglobales bacterium]|nr:polysaccharide biosynthesis/export family protein [Terriglobales bacterium]
MKAPGRFAMLLFIFSLVGSIAVCAQSGAPAAPAPTAQPLTPEALSRQATQPQPATATSPRIPGQPEQAASAPASPSTAAEAIPMETQIGPGDLVKVSVLGAPDYDQDVRVSGSGDASLALIGPVHIAGLTTDQAQQLIREKLKAGGYFNDPQVAVFEKEYATQGVSVLGEIQHPGVYPILGPHRLFDVLSLGGGTTQLAGQAITVTHRRTPSHPETVYFSNNPKTDAKANVEIYPGDTVVVSKAGVVYIVGQVNRPSGVVLNSSGITVMQAIAMAEGVKPGASMNNAKIIRRSEGGPKEIRVELKKMFAGKSPDLKLQAEDILFVPTSTAKNIGVQTLDGIVRLTTAVAVYRVP